MEICVNKTQVTMCDGPGQLVHCLHDNTLCAQLLEEHLPQPVAECRSGDSPSLQWRHELASVIELTEEGVKVSDDEVGPALTGVNHARLVQADWESVVVVLILVQHALIAENVAVVVLDVEVEGGDPSAEVAYLELVLLVVNPNGKLVSVSSYLIVN